VKKLTLCLAEKKINIYPVFDYLAEYCQSYLAETVDDSDADYIIGIEQSDIDFERIKSAEEDKKEGLPVREFPPEYLETLAAYRKIAENLLQDNVLLFHGSVIAVDGEGYLFTAKSGTGKSTHTGLWREHFGSRAVIVNDDKPLLHITTDGVTAYGTPWDGKHRLSANISVPLKAVCLLNRGERNEIKRIDKREAFVMLCQQSNRPSQPNALMQTLSLIEKLGSTVALYSLSCNMEPEAAIVAYEGMNG